MNSLQGLTVLILGLGDSGLAMAAWCARCGAQVRVWDSRAAPPQATALCQGVPEAEFSTGPLEDDTLPSLFRGVSRVFKSPGLAPGDIRLASLYRFAAQQGISIQGELDLFVQALADLNCEHAYAPKLLAITGTNGKTTTTSMAYHLIQRTGLRVAMAGNIGPTLLQTLSEALDLEALPAKPDRPPATPPEPPVEGLPEAPLSAGPAFAYLPQVWVLELSSFQLHDVQGFEPSAAAVLNITEDHLDWHGHMTAYAADKARIFGSTGVMVINRDDPLVQAMAEPTQTRPVKPPKVQPRRVLRFGLNPPQHPGDFGIMLDHGMAWLVRAREADATIKPKRGTVIPEDILIQHLMPADALRVRGRHNAANALAALALATAIGCPLAPMLHGLREYEGEPHRVAYVASLHGVDFVNDSKGTNVGATVAAITGLGADRAPAKLVLILGGEGKGQNFAPLSDPLRMHVRAVATLGRDAALIEDVVQAVGLPLQRFDTLQQATRWARAQAQQGDTVLLSPACASLDMFDSYKHRAQIFVEEVQAMVQESGEVVA
ncbi:MAG: UDP-N-acetylmuramoyl-L-alanine--D-glutamate ligase [Burkholderiales bacterium]